MVPLYERRHRINNNEVPEVKRALHLYLKECVENGTIINDLESAFQCYYRLVNYREGRPCYPSEINTRVIEAQLKGDAIQDPDISLLYEQTETCSKLTLRENQCIPYCKLHGSEDCHKSGDSIEEVS